MKTLAVLTAILTLLLFITACQSGVINENIEADPQQATAQAIVERMQAASATAEASTTSTAFLDYGAEVMSAREVFDNSGTTSYRWKYAHVNPTGSGQQIIDITVQNGTVAAFKHDCFPEEVCQLMRVEDETAFTVQGVLDQLLGLAEQRHAMAIIRFDEQYGFPRSVIANSDEAPYYIQWTTEEFEVLQ